MITLQGLLIGTGILWVLNAVLVLPLTNVLVKQRLAQPVYSTISSDMQAVADNPEITSLVRNCYMAVDTVVLGLAGFIFGVTLGWFFIGFCTKATGWPGLIAFMAMSMLGSSIR